MMDNIKFLIICIVIAGLVWGGFQVFGMYTFSIMLVITFLGLIKGVKPKFGKKKGDGPE